MHKTLFIFAILFVASRAWAQDRLVLRPDLGASLVSTAQDLSYLQGSIRVSRDGPGIRIFNPLSQGPAWSLFLRPPEGVELAAGCYERALGTPPATRPEIDFSFNSSACNAYGRFRILEIDVNAAGDVKTLAVDFNQQCEHYGRAIAGQLRFNSSMPISADFPRAVIEPSGFFSVMAADGAIGPIRPAKFELTRRTLVAMRNGANGASFFYSDPLSRGSVLEWKLDLAGPDYMPLTAMSYPLATRYPFQNSGEAGLNFTYGSGNCSSLRGDFTVTTILMDQLDNVPLEINAIFNQRCPNLAGPLTQGTISFIGNLIGPSNLPDNLLKSGFEGGESFPSGSPFYSSACN